MELKFDITITNDNGEPCSNVQIASFTISAPLQPQRNPHNLPFHDRVTAFRLMEYITNALHEIHAKDDFIENFGECRDWEVIEKQYINHPFPTMPKVMIYKSPFCMPASIRRIPEVEHIHAQSPLQLPTEP